MTLYSTRGRVLVVRHRLHRPPGRLRQFVRVVSAFALSGGGAVALLAAFVLASTSRTAAVGEILPVGVLLLAAGWWLGLAPGEAWQQITGGAP